jgi:hypothetical protein
LRHHRPHRHPPRNDAADVVKRHDVGSKGGIASVIIVTAVDTGRIASRGSPSSDHGSPSSGHGSPSLVWQGIFILFFLRVYLQRHHRHGRAVMAVAMTLPGPQ